jgi:hypothetical protein
MRGRVPSFVAIAFTVGAAPGMAAARQRPTAGAALVSGTATKSIAAFAIAVVALGAGVGPATSQIPPSELPGRERSRFVDPPGARLMQPTGPSTVLPYGRRKWELDCPPPTRQGKRSRKRCAPTR